MRIAMVMDAPFPPDARVENEARVLLGQGHEVFLFTIDYGAAARRRTAGPAESRPERERVRDIEIRRMNAGRLLYKSSALVCTVPLFSRLVAPKIRSFIDECRPDLLHLHDMVIGDAALEANRQFDLPVVLDLHENRPEIMKHYRHVNRIPGRWLIDPARWKAKERELMRRCDHLIVVTEQACEVACRTAGVPPEKCTALPNVVWPEDYRPPSSDSLPVERTTGWFTLLYIGDTSLRRGTMTLLQALDLLREELPDLQLLMVGSSSQDRELHRYVRRRNLEPFVSFEGWQTPDRLPAYLAASDLCLSPLLRNLHHDTTFANKIFQYMAAGKPVVVSDCPAQADLVRNEGCGAVFRAGDAEDLAARIRELYADGPLRERMGRAGEKAVRERWNWRVTGQALPEAYGKALSARR